MEIARINAAAAEPDVQRLIKMFCKVLGRKKLGNKQSHLLAQIFGGARQAGRRLVQQCATNAPRNSTLSN